MNNAHEATAAMEAFSPLFSTPESREDAAIENGTWHPNYDYTTMTWKE